MAPEGKIKQGVSGRRRGKLAMRRGGRGGAPFFTAMRSSAVRGWSLVGSVSLPARYFSMAARSKTAPDLAEMTGSTGVSPVTAARQRDRERERE